MSLVFNAREHLIKQNIKSKKKTAPDFWTAESWGVKTVLQPVRAAIIFCVRNVKNARTWERKQNVRRVRSARLKNVQIYMSFRAAKQIAPIIATTALLNKGEREKFNYYNGGENEKDFINEFGVGFVDVLVWGIAQLQRVKEG